MDLTEVLEFLPARFGEAAREVARTLASMKVRHALCGGIAVGAHGYVRATRDIDFLVGDEVFEHHGLVVSFKPGVPIQVAGVTIDYLSGAALRIPVDEVLEAPPQSHGLAVVPVEPLVQMKLLARRKQDQADVIGLLRAGADYRSIRGYLQARAPELLELFDELHEEAG